MNYLMLDLSATMTLTLFKTWQRRLISNWMSSSSHKKKRLETIKSYAMYNLQEFAIN